MCRNKGCPDFAEDAAMFAIFLAVLGLPIWILAIRDTIMPLTRRERGVSCKDGRAVPILVAVLLFPFNIGVNGLTYCWTVLVSPSLVFVYYVAVKRRSGFWPPSMANARECAAAKDAEELPIQAGDAVTYCAKNELWRVWLVELYGSGEWRARESQDQNAPSCYFLNEASHFHKGHSWMPYGEPME